MTEWKIYEDKYLVAVNKPPGIVCEPRNFPGLQLVHRIDKDTSGVVLLCKDPDNLEKFQSLFKKRSVKKVYLGLFFGRVLDRETKQPREERNDFKLTQLNKSAGLVEAPVQRIAGHSGKFGVGVLGRPSQTSFKVLRYFRYKSLDLSLVEVYPLTGRTHQIRVHFAAGGWPLVADSTYGPKRLNDKLPLSRQFLHAKSLAFKHPFSGEALRIEASLPDDLKSFLKLIRRETTEEENP